MDGNVHFAVRELASLIASVEGIASRPTSKCDYTPLLTLTARLGLRLGEVLGFQWCDFNYEAGTLSVQRQWTVYGSYEPPKTEAGRPDASPP
jgi:integrase